MAGERPSRMAGDRPIEIAGCLYFYRIYQICAATTAILSLHGQLIGQLVARIEGVFRIEQTYSVADIQIRREVLPSV